ncbi:MAG TPA: hypothetical protein VMU90_11845, partial [Solirubrobacteraceae bacterium]|nr:hypothetical protein [Solirubrobacteraceae bacterium]
WPKARSILANAVKDGEPASRIAELRRDFRVARTAQLVRELLSEDPPPTPDQRGELTGILAGDGR